MTRHQAETLASRFLDAPYVFDSNDFGFVVAGGYEVEGEYREVMAHVYVDHNGANAVRLDLDDSGEYATRAL